MTHFLLFSYGYRQLFFLFKIFREDLDELKMWQSNNKEDETKWQKVLAFSFERLSRVIDFGSKKKTTCSIYLVF